MTLQNVVVAYVLRNTRPPQSIQENKDGSYSNRYLRMPFQPIQRSM